MLPWAMPAFVAFLTWRVLYQPIGGGINLILTADRPLSRGHRLARPALDRDAGGDRRLRLARLPVLVRLASSRRCRSVPAELYEAARVDGANAWQRFWAVTLPGIRQVVIVTALLSSIWTANGFENVWLLTQGGPSDATMVFPVLAYFGMQTQRIGEAAAVSVAMLPVLAILVFAATAMMQQDDE